MLEITIFMKADVKCQAEDVRKAFGKCASAETKDLFLHHGKGISSILYSKPMKNIIKLYVVKDDMIILNEISRIMVDFEVFGIKANDSIEIKQNNLLMSIRKAPYLVSYSARSPIIYAFLNRDIKYVDKLRFNNPEMLVDFAKSKIIETIEMRTRELNTEIIIPNDLSLDFADLTFFGHKFRDKMLPAVYANKISSNYYLPKFLGYKVGLGYGEINLI